MNLKPQNRYSAFLCHMVISAILFLLITTVILFVWYPGFLFHTDGGWQGLRLIAAVDFVLGPILTLLVYKPGKPKLAFDLTLISIVQLSCLLSGCYVVYSDRPIAIIFAEDTIQTLSRSSFQIHDINPNTLPLVREERIAKIGIDLPQDPHQLSALKKNLLIKGPLHVHTERYIPWRKHKDTLLSFSLNPDVVAKTTDSRINRSNSNFFYLRSRFGEYLINVNSDTLLDSKVIQKL